WLTAISRHRGTHSGGPNFIFELCTRKIAQEDLLTLDLRSWRVAMTAAEPVRAETLARFARRFAPVGFDRRAFSPGYGLSEGTCKVISVPTSEEPLILTLRADRLEQHAAVLAEPGPDTRTVVGCGRPGRDVRIEIVDAQTRQRRAEDQVGEIWISGHGVAQSYWGQPEATEQYLRATILGEESPRFLRTGDLGFLHDGQLFITGRIKDMIIVRGTNHYPQDIESTVQDAHPCIRAGCCAAFAYEEEGEERVAVVAEVERRQLDAWIPNNDRRIADPTPRLPPSSASFDADEVGEAITRAVAEEHGLRVSRVALIRAGAIPKTTSGKIQRQATKKALLQGQLELITNPAGEREAKQSTWDLTRSRITEIVSRIAGIPADKLRPSVSLHNYGVDSLSAVNITYEIGLLIQADAPSWLLTERDTIDKLVDYVLSAGGKQ
ncbi:MAG: AMP-binding protein, partial [Deltaproteobacteria bacterium]|nr:AMP-binding protein [Deltaproteobacteria bacterium]